MNSIKHPRVFDPLDLEIIDRVYETAWAQVEAREPLRDRGRDGEREEALRKLIFAFAGTGHVDFDNLCDSVLANMPSNRSLRQKAQARSGRRLHPRPTFVADNKGAPTEVAAWTLGSCPRGGGGSLAAHVLTALFNCKTQTLRAPALRASWTAFVAV